MALLQADAAYQAITSRLEATAGLKHPKMPALARVLRAHFEEFEAARVAAEAAGEAGGEPLGGGFTCACLTGARHFTQACAAADPAPPLDRGLTGPDDGVTRAIVFCNNRELVAAIQQELRGDEPLLRARWGGASGGGVGVPRPRPRARGRGGGGQAACHKLRAWR
jgi:hypothetical protein